VDYSCSLLEAMDGIDAAPAPVPAVDGPPPAGSYKLALVAWGLMLIGVLLLLHYISSRIFCLYNEDATIAEVAATSPSSSPRAPSASLPIPQPRHTVPMSLLPVFVYVASSPGEETADCAVCLVFREREAGRLLPRCGHGFHEECIVTWLQVNTTCPLCRTPVDTK
jgi:hypothetical protein